MRFALVVFATILAQTPLVSAKVGPTTLQLMNANASRFDVGMVQLNNLLLRRWPLIQDFLRPNPDFDVSIEDLWAGFSVNTGRITITAYLTGDVTPFLACHQFFSSLRGILGIDPLTGKPTDDTGISLAAASFGRPGYSRKDEAHIDVGRMDQIIWVQAFAGPKTFASSDEKSQIEEVLSCDGRLLGTDFSYK